MFFFSGLLFWARVIDPGPLRPRLIWPVRVAYAVGAMIVGWVLAIVLVVVPHPLYAHYANLIHRPGGITADTDQQIAAGIMWVPGSISYTIAMLIGFYRWLEPESTPPELHSESPRPAVHPESSRPGIHPESSRPGIHPEATPETKVLTV
jgi:cytochrome c oxidase assembly factor CtaG